MKTGAVFLSGMLGFLSVSGVATAQDAATVELVRPAPTLAAADEVEQWSATFREQPALSVSLVGLPVLSEGSRSNDVVTLRTALAERGFLAADVASEDPLVFDAAVAESVRAAQRFHGLVEDGKAGNQLYLNLAGATAGLGQDLWAWGQEIRAQAEKARAAGHRKLIIVNIPSYTLKAIDLETGQTIVETRVIVGKASRRTPIFTTNVVNLKYNPDWTPTANMKRQGKRYVAAGPNNPLGRIRFSTDNNVSIYLHHTNEPDLFEKPTRALSSGCVRVERWDDLAAFVADSDVDTIHSQVATKRTTFEKVETVPVVMSYSQVDVTAGRPARFLDVYQLGSRASLQPTLP